MVKKIKVGKYEFAFLEEPQGIFLPNEGHFCHKYNSDCVYDDNTGCDCTQFCKNYYCSDDFQEAFEVAQDVYFAWLEFKKSLSDIELSPHFYTAYRCYSSVIDTYGWVKRDIYFTKSEVLQMLHLLEKCKTIVRNHGNKHGIKMLENIGHVYLMKHCAPYPVYKIGYSISPIERGNHFNVKSPYAVEYIHGIRTNNMRRLEKLLHKQYANKRLNGEWFDLDDSDIGLLFDMREYIF